MLQEASGVVPTSDLLNLVCCHALSLALSHLRCAHGYHTRQSAGPLQSSIDDPGPRRTRSTHARGQLHRGTRRRPRTNYALMSRLRPRYDFLPPSFISLSESTSVCVRIFFWNRGFVGEPLGSPSFRRDIIQRSVGRLPGLLMRWSWLLFTGYGQGQPRLFLLLFFTGVVPR